MSCPADSPSPRPVPLPASETDYSKNFVFAAACLGMLLFGIVFLSLGSVNNMLAERFRLDDNAIGTLTALLPFGILAGSLVFGPVVDRFGYRWMLVGCALIVGAGLEGMAFAGSQGLMQAFVFLIGFGGGVLNGATNALAADVSEGERGAKLSLLGVFFGIGSLLTPSTLALLSRSLSLTAIVAGIGALVLVPAAFCLAIRFPPPKQRAEKFSPAKSLRFFRDPVFLFAALALAVQSGMEGMSNDWTTRYFRKAVLAGPDSIEWKTQLGAGGGNGCDGRRASGLGEGPQANEFAACVVREPRHDCRRCAGPLVGGRIRRIARGGTRDRRRARGRLPGSAWLHRRSQSPTVRRRVRRNLRRGPGRKHGDQQDLRLRRSDVRRSAIPHNDARLPGLCGSPAPVGFQATFAHLGIGEP